MRGPEEEGRKECRAVRPCATNQASKFSTDTQSAGPHSKRTRGSPARRTKHVLAGRQPSLELLQVVLPLEGRKRVAVVDPGCRRGGRGLRNEAWLRSMTRQAEQSRVQRRAHGHSAAQHTSRTRHGAEHEGEAAREAARVVLAARGGGRRGRAVVRQSRGRAAKRGSSAAAAAPRSKQTASWKGRTGALSREASPQRELDGVDGGLDGALAEALLLQLGQLRQDERLHLGRVLLLDALQRSSAR